MQNYMVIIPSQIYPDQVLVEKYIDGLYIGANYMPFHFTGEELEEASKRILRLKKLVPFKGKSQT